MKRTIESLTPPANKQVMWLDISKEVKQLKAYINGERVVVNDDTKNNEEIVNKVLEKIDKDFESYIKKEDADKAYAPKSDLEKKVDKVQGKGLSTEDFTSAEKAKLKGLPDNINVLDLMSYGISWKPNVADPRVTRVGNMSYHETLPIQNNMRGCIAQMKGGVKIKYFLDPTDWRWREDPRGSVLKDQTLIAQNVEDGIYRIENDVFSTLQYENQWLRIQGIIPCQVIDIDTGVNEATIRIQEEFNDGELPSSSDVELGAVLNGYDGEVMVLVPEFWIKSWDTDTRREVRVSPSKIDDTWEHQPRILIGAYHDTVLNTVPENMGYLSTLEVDSALSIANTHDYCRGGSNDKTYDQYITTDRFRSMLGKPRTGLSRATMRANCRKSGKEILSYLQYKRVLYWLYVIEYANFNCQDDFQDVTSDAPFKMGGLDKGVTTVSSNYWNSYNALNPLTPNGYTNEFGNGTNIKEMILNMSSNSKHTYTTSQYVPRWHGIENPFGDIYNSVDGIIINSSSILLNDKKYSEVYVTDDPSLYSDSNYSKMRVVGIELNEDEFIREWDLGNTAEIVPRLNGGGVTKFKCDFHVTKDLTGLRTLILGGNGSSGSYSGLGYFNSFYNNVGAYTTTFGFRSSCVVA